MLWEAYQQTRIATAERVAESAEAKIDHYGRALEDLRRHVDRLSLACQAMWELLRERSDLMEAEIEAKMLEIDGRDGMQDGKISVQPLDCPACGRRTNSKRSLCIMCGAPIKRPFQFGA